MKLMLVSVVATAVVTLLASPGPVHGFQWSSAGGRLMSRENPDADTSFERWEAEGCLELHVWTPDKEQDEGGDRVAADGEDWMEVEKLKKFRYRKFFDSNKKSYRVDLYPVQRGYSGYGDDYKRPRETPATAVVLVHENEAYMLTEEDPVGRVRCRRVPYKFQHKRKHPLREARWNGVGFHRHEICNEYSHLPMEYDQRCMRLERIQLNVCAFTHTPVSFFVKGSTKPQGQEDNDEDEDEQDSQHRQYHFAIEGVVDEFSTEIEREDMLFRIPEQVKKICEQGGDEENDFSVTDAITRTYLNVLDAVF